MSSSLVPQQLGRTPTAHTSTTWTTYAGRGTGNHPTKDGERPRPNPREQKDKQKDTKGANATKKGLQDARKKQRQQETAEKYKNTVCHVCGEKGHSPNWPGCTKHPDHNSSAGKPGPTLAKKVKSAQLPSHGIKVNDDHFITLDSPRSDSGASEE